MPFKIGPRPFACLASEANGTYNYDKGVADPAFAFLITTNMLVAEGPSGLVPYDGSLPLRGVALVAPNENNEFGYVGPGPAELKGWQLVHRTSGPRAVTGSKVVADPAAGNLSLNGVAVAIAANEHLAAIAAAITASAAGVTARVVDGNRLRLVADAGGPLVIAGDAAVVAELGFVAGAVAAPTPAQIAAEDNAALAALGFKVR